MDMQKKGAELTTAEKADRLEPIDYLSTKKCMDEKTKLLDYVANELCGIVPNTKLVDALHDEKAYTERTMSTSQRELYFKEYIHIPTIGIKQRGEAKKELVTHMRACLKTLEHWDELYNSWKLMHVSKTVPLLGQFIQLKADTYYELLDEGEELRATNCFLCDSSDKLPAANKLLNCQNCPITLSRIYGATEEFACERAGLSPYKKLIDSLPSSLLDSGLPKCKADSLRYMGAFIRDLKRLSYYYVELVFVVEYAPEHTENSQEATSNEPSGDKPNEL